MINDIVADYLSKIRNAISAGAKEVNVLNSHMTLPITKILKEEGYIEDYKEEGKIINIALKFIDKKCAIRKLERVSRPGVRTYMSFNEIPKVINGLGINIFTTSKGIMTGKKARLEKVGGEYLCNIW